MPPLGRAQRASRGTFWVLRSEPPTTPSPVCAPHRLRQVYHEFKLSDTDDAFPTSDIKCANEGDCPVNKTSTEKSGRFKVVRLEDPDGALAEGRERAPLPPRVGCDAQPFLERILLDFQHRVTDSSGAKPIMSDVVWVRKFTDGKPRADSEYPYVVYEFQLRVSKRAAWALHKALTEGGPAESDERAVRDALAKQLLAAWPTLYKIVQGWRPRGLRTKITHRNDGPHNIVNARIVCRNDGTWKFAHDVLC